MAAIVEAYCDPEETWRQSLFISHPEFNPGPEFLRDYLLSPFSR
jgi:hypothetical protein